MKNTKTVAVSMPLEIARKIDRLAQDLNLSRSALLTMIISVYLKERGVQ